MKVIVIGGGASGIIAALKASEKHNVILLEAKEKIGKKILVTGNGKCNLWNANLWKDHISLSDYYYTDNYERLNKIFEKKAEVFSYLKKELNIYMREKNTYLYPYSNSAVSVRSLLEREIMNKKNIQVVYNFEAMKIEKHDNLFKVYSTDKYYEADKIIISTGGLASNLGDDSFTKLLNNIKINPYKPSLVPLTANESYLKNLNGLRTDVELKLYENSELIKKEIGEIQFTDYGISGIVSLNLSGYVSRLNHPKLYIDFMPELSENDLEKIKDEFNSIKQKTIEELLETYFNYKLMFVILKKSGIDRNTCWYQLTDKEIEKLFQIIKHFDIHITGTLGFDRAQVMTGGISLNEVNDNLELKKETGIFIVGEALDIDGICGGYNLASAFITGFIAGSEV